MSHFSSAFLHRYLHPSHTDGSIFYGSRLQERPSRENDTGIHSLLQSISSTLCEMQGQLSTIKGQNAERDLSLCIIIYTLEGGSLHIYFSYQLTVIIL